ncbi:TetR/AcrR family transcriptional regulator [Kutzneria kofuensis]|uniref:AcrR family transcriptional regulator n=1 Tax=Kutzneria kofuensis TaxID=103725 RepID=A0A7W9KEQ9_9PSEU|nr:TetR/AcrR family transcriptional regulator [Kutzneria kofuensis]MBB5891270.1 AcrR family transcriptional regulator [Kutzneria kofuensis]
MSEAERAAPSGARADGKRKAIVEAALLAFLTEGFDVSMDRIAAAAGVSKVTVYNHFDSKENLFRAVVSGQLHDALSVVEQLVESRLGDSDDVRDELIKACRAWVTALTVPDMMALRTLVVAESKRFPELGETWLEHGPNRLHAVFATALTRLGQRGVLDIPDVELAVLQLSGLVLSPNLVYGAYGRTPAKKLADRLIVAGVDMFLSYYGVE